MRIVDVSAFYSPGGGGVRTYVERKVRALPELGHEIVVIAPGRTDGEQVISPAASIVTIASPAFPLDRKYSYFNDEVVLHAAIERIAPDIVEASSPWSSASMVARYPGPVARSLVMHADPLSAYAYRYLDPLMPRDWIDRSFDWFWQHLRRLDAAYDIVVTASEGLTRRMRDGGLTKVATIPMGVEPGIFDPGLRDEALRATLLARCGLEPGATLLIGAGRLSREKRWPMVVEAVIAAGIARPVGFVLIGDGKDRQRIERAIGDNPHIHLLAPVQDRHALATLLASADALVHGCEAETFGFVPAEARASGLPLLLPDQGGAADQLAGSEGMHYRSASAASLADTIARFIDGDVARARARAVEVARHVVTMDDHFSRLCARYAAILDRRRAGPVASGDA